MAGKTKEMCIRYIIAQSKEDVTMGRLYELLKCNKTSKGYTFLEENPYSIKTDVYYPIKKMIEKLDCVCKEWYIFIPKAESRTWLTSHYMFGMPYTSKSDIDSVKNFVGVKTKADVDKFLAAQKQAYLAKLDNEEWYNEYKKIMEDK